ncbi:hypothetical protein IJH72_02345 [Candidatus Saccharibacteria bacterium]|nr:hypothetical protein [Candidatus Saccharibacteria bacterium]MBR0372756.1 hypothetical protein [Candidatus Saccharibacteria bacterium]
MNAYYYEGFKPEIFSNVWAFFAIAMFIAMVALGVMQYYMTPKLGIRRRYNERMFAFVASIGAIIFGVLLFVESSDGIIQMFDNKLLAGESPLWSVIWAPISILGAAIVFFGVLYGLAVWASWTREGYLLSKRRGILRERKEETEAKKAEVVERKPGKNPEMRFKYSNLNI